jgi:hypothetical protein
MFKKNTPYIILFFSILFVTLLWDKILIPLNDAYTYGVYKENNYHPINEIIRFIFYIFVPLLLFFISFKLINKNNCFQIKEIFLYKKSILESEDNKLNNYTSILLVLLIIFEFLSIDFLEIHKSLDSFHDGVYLSASNNFLIKKGLWTSSFVEYGLINFDSAFIWSIFNVKSIGSAKFLKYVYLLLNKVILILILNKVSQNLFHNKKNQLIFFLIISLFSISLVDYYQFEASEFPSRLFIMLLFQFLFLVILTSNKNSYLIPLIFGIMTPFSILWSLDMGIFINVLLFFILIFFFIRNDFKIFKFIIIGLFISYTTIIYLFEYSEIIKLFETFYFMFTNNEQSGGLIYPTPFLSGEARFTKALLMYILSGVLLILFCLKKDFEIPNSIKIFFISLFFSSILVFKQALTRSDAAHIKAASGTTYLIIVSIILFLIFDYLEKKDFFSKIFKKFDNISLTRNVAYFFIFLSTFFYFDINFKNVFLFTNKIDIYINQKDVNFLNKKQIELINYYKKISKNDSCIQGITNQAALPYLINKPSCTRYYTNWYLITNKHQNKFIEEIEEKKPRLILYWSKLDLYNFDDEKRIPHIQNYLLNNYKTYNKTQDWHFLVKNN